jgi:hypothetical protein
LNRAFSPRSGKRLLIAVVPIACQIGRGRGEGRGLRRAGQRVGNARVAWPSGPDRSRTRARRRPQWSSWNNSGRSGRGRFDRTPPLGTPPASGWRHGRASAGLHQPWSRPRSRSGRSLQRFLDTRRERCGLAAGGSRFHAEQIGAPGQCGRDLAGGLTHASPERVSDYCVPAMLPNCVAHLGKYSRDFRVRRHEHGADGTAARPRA